MGGIDGSLGLRMEVQFAEAAGRRTFHSGGIHMGVETEGTASAELGARSGGMVPELSGIVGRLAVEVDGKTVGELVVNHGHVELGGNGAPTQGSLCFRTAEDLWKVLRGQLNPIVASLQGRMFVQGDVAFAVKVILCISAASPFGASTGKGA